MAVKITIAVERTAKDRDLEIVETLNITVVMKGEFFANFYFNFSSSLSNSPDAEKREFLSKKEKKNCGKLIFSTVFRYSNSRRPRKSPEASNDSNSENFKRYEERNRDSDRYRSDSNRERETRNRH
jgi:hypothetical protein